MIPKKLQKDAEYLRIVRILKKLRETEAISDEEYARAKRFYRTLVGTEMIVAN